MSKPRRSRPMRSARTRAAVIAAMLDRRAIESEEAAARFIDLAFDLSERICGPVFLDPGAVLEIANGSRFRSPLNADAVLLPTKGGQPHALLRQLVMVGLARLGAPTRAICVLLDRDHTVVMHGIRKCEAELGESAELDAALSEAVKEARRLDAKRALACGPINRASDRR